MVSFRNLPVSKEPTSSLYSVCCGSADKTPGDSMGTVVSFETPAEAWC